tara:strand:+ start:16326 stop:16514 length:189 start_codon:yes stop_codon:yes gene_type:complete
MGTYQSAINKKKHEAALDVVKRFEEQGGKITVLAHNERSKLKPQKFTPRKMIKARDKPSNLL